MGGTEFYGGQIVMDFAKWKDMAVANAYIFF